MDSKQIGNITELEVLTAATKNEIQVSIPFGDRSRYDQIWEKNGRLYKIQIKTSRVLDEQQTGIIFCCNSNTRVQGKTKHSTYSKEEIDFFATYFNGQCYVVPVEECSSEKRLRFIPPKNNQKIGISMAIDYTLERWCANLD